MQHNWSVPFAQALQRHSGEWKLVPPKGMPERTTVPCGRDAVPQNTRDGAPHNSAAPLASRQAPEAQEESGLHEGLG